MAFLNPAKVVEDLDIRPGMKVADFGCGSGHFAVETAKRIGKEGVVYAIDVQEEVLDALKGRAAVEHLPNMEIVRADLETPCGSHLADNLVDLALISNMLFQVEDKHAVAKEASRILKPGGKAVVIEWKLSADRMGPPKEVRVSKETMRDIFTQAGFIMDREFNAGENHYGIVFKKHE
jgi:ubiquinone/menaquinone biosynthesis C-methylase UbiE